MKITKKIFNGKLIVICSFVLMATFGCNDFLDIEPENDLIKQEFWKSKEDVESSLAATYDAFRDTYMKSFIYGELRADLFEFGGNGDNIPDYNRIAENDITTTLGVVSWSEYYKAINMANTVMYYAPIVKDIDNTFTQDMIDGMKAEMIYIRSLSYFYLVRLWKDVPLVLSPSISDTVDLYLPKSSEGVVLNQIVKDLKMASGLAYTTEFQDNAPWYKGRANKYAIQALLADVLLWSERYSEAIVYCDSIINTKKFGLEPYSTWFNLYYPGNSLRESLFEIQYDDNLEQENPIYVSVLGNIDETPKFESLFEDGSTDLRLCGGAGTVQKYYGISEDIDRADNQRDANFIYYRYADVLLIKAEALAETGNLTDANYLVRDVAERAGQTHIPVLNYDGFMSALMDERAREFALEGKRWFDLMRWAKKRSFENKDIIMGIMLAKTTNAQIKAILKSKLTDTMAYYLPINETELEYNQKLIQNSFYAK